MPVESRMPEPVKSGEVRLPLSVFFPQVKEMMKAQHPLPPELLGPVVPAKPAAALHATRREITASPPSLFRTVPPRDLTAAERRVLLLAVQGIADKEICTQLRLALSTVKNCLRDVRKKCGVKTTPELVARYAKIEPAALCPHLTNRQKDILHHLAAGHSNAQIATILNIGLTTVKSHIKRMNQKIAPPEPGNRRSLVSFARAHRVAANP